MEDEAIEELETVAEEYADIRDQRISLNQDESALKERVLAIMHANGKKQYVHGNVEIRLVSEGEKVKVRIHKDRPADEEVDDTTEGSGTGEASAAD